MEVVFQGQGGENGASGGCRWVGVLLGCARAQREHGCMVPTLRASSRAGSWLRS